MRSMYMETKEFNQRKYKEVRYYSKLPLYCRECDDFYRNAIDKSFIENKGVCYFCYFKLNPMPEINYDLIMDRI